MTLCLPFCYSSESYQVIIWGNFINVIFRLWMISRWMHEWIFIICILPLVFWVTETRAAKFKKCSRGNMIHNGRKSHKNTYAHIGKEQEDRICSHTYVLKSLRNLKHLHVQYSYTCRHALFLLEFTVFFRCFMYATALQHTTWFKFWTNMGSTGKRIEELCM
jgi:hypothetical protein